MCLCEQRQWPFWRLVAINATHCFRIQEIDSHSRVLIQKEGDIKPLATRVPYSQLKPVVHRKEGEVSFCENKTGLLLGCIVPESETDCSVPEGLMGCSVPEGEAGSFAGVSVAEDKAVSLPGCCVPEGEAGSFAGFCVAEDKAVSLPGCSGPEGEAGSFAGFCVAEDKAVSLPGCSGPESKASSVQGSSGCSQSRDSFITGVVTAGRRGGEALPEKKAHRVPADLVVMKDMLRRKQCLTDSHIDHFSAILKDQFPHVGGLQRCSIFESSNHFLVGTPKDKFVQGPIRGPIQALGTRPYTRPYTSFL
jgi:hypothetical protein